LNSTSPAAPASTSWRAKLANAVKYGESFTAIGTVATAATASTSSRVSVSTCRPVSSTFAATR
jgi:hypothetical protein